MTEETKAAQRAACLAARRALSAEERAARSEAICRRLLALPELTGARTVLSYLAAWDEADLAAAHRALRDRGVRLCFPFVTGRGTMEALLPEEDAALLPGAFGLLAPDPARSALVAPETLALVLVPCVGFDTAAAITTAICRAVSGPCAFARPSPVRSGPPSSAARTTCACSGS